MSKISVVYWSGTGNTEAMAMAVASGVKAGGKEVDLVQVSSASLEDLKEQPVFALGCPAMGSEELEDSEMEPFVAEVEKFAAGKIIALFGSYSWAEGQWMIDWAERMKNAGASVLNGEGLICYDAPDADMVLKCEELGKQMAVM